MNTLQHFLHFILHIDIYLAALVTTYGAWTYAILFCVIFCETGLVLLPFLPGDSLLFAAGSIAATTAHALNIQLLFLLLFFASVVGNKVNYLIGRAIGPQLFKDQPQQTLFNRCLNRKYLAETQQFYAKHGGKTIVLARFLPIIRSFAPFVAGMSRMGVQRFSFYNILSALLWVGLLLSAGYFFGTLPIVKENFSLVIYAIIAISLLPPSCLFFYRKLIVKS